MTPINSNLMKGESSTQKITVKSKGKGKQPKRFLEKNDAISLAAAIGDAQEGIAQTKAEKRHKPEPEQLKESDRKPTSNSKAKLKATKAVLSSARVKAKKDRSKLRKESFKNAKNGGQSSTSQTVSSQDATDTAVRQVRKVSFA